jgi:hypothetical protein
MAHTELEEEHYYEHPYTQTGKIIICPIEWL